MSNPYLRMLTVAIVTGGLSFFGASWDSGWTEAIRAAGFAAFGGAAGVIGIDARRSRA